MGYLALDTSTSQLSVGLAEIENNKLISTYTLNNHRQHGETLVHVIAEMFKLAQWEPQSIKKLIVGVGPGSYTGLRIGITFAKMWAKSLKIELNSISSLALMINPLLLENQTLFLPMLDARQDNVYVGGYVYEHDKLINVLEDQHLPLNAVFEWAKAQNYGQIVIISNVNIKKERFMSSEVRFIRNLPQAQWGFHKAFENITTVIQDVDTFVPVYGRQTQAEREWEQGLFNDVTKLAKKSGDYIEYHT